MLSRPSERSGTASDDAIRGKIGAYWEDTIQALAQAGYRVILPDQVGFGKLSKPNLHYSFHLLASNTKKLLDELGVERAKGKEPKGTFYFSAPFRGLPRGRSEDSRSSRPAVACVHFSHPYGRPRLMLSRTAMSSASVCGSFSTFRQFALTPTR